jgi:hypothetical protein
VPTVASLHEGLVGEYTIPPTLFALSRSSVEGIGEGSSLGLERRLPPLLPLSGKLGRISCVELVCQPLVGGIATERS